MPGNGGIVPFQNSFSVPVEIPEWPISTTISPAPGALSARVSRRRSSGPFKKTARVSMIASQLWPVHCAKDSASRYGFIMSVYSDTHMCQVCVTLLAEILSFCFDAAQSPGDVRAWRAGNRDPLEACGATHLGDTRGRAHAPGAHGHGIEREIHVPGTLGAGPTRHRLGHDQPPAGRQRGMALEEQVGHGVIGMIVEHPDQRNRIRPFWQRLVPERAAAEINPARQPRLGHPPRRLWHDLRQIKELQVQTRWRSAIRVWNAPDPPPTSIRRDTPRNGIIRSTSSATSAW